VDGHLIGGKPGLFDVDQRGRHQDGASRGSTARGPMSSGDKCRPSADRSAEVKGRAGEHGRVQRGMGETGSPVDGCR